MKAIAFVVLFVLGLYVLAVSAADVGKPITNALTQRK